MAVGGAVLLTCLQRKHVDSEGVQSDFSLRPLPPIHLRVFLDQSHWASKINFPFGFYSSYGKDQKRMCILICPRNASEVTIINHCFGI